MTEVVYESKLLELIFGDYSYRINFNVSYPIYSVKIEIYDGITPEEAVNQAIKYLRQRILLEYKKTKSIRKVRRLVKDYMILLENREEIIKEVKEEIEKIQRMVEEYIKLKFPIDFSNIRVPEINLNNIRVDMKCNGDIESGIFPLRDYGLNYTYGERECKGERELTFEWGSIILSRKEYRNVHDTEHCLLYDRKEDAVYVTIKPNNGYKVVKVSSYESYSSFYHYDNSSERFERILRATHKPIVKLVANSYSTYSDRHTYSESRFCEAYYVFPAEAKVLIKIAGTFQNKDYEHYEIR